MASTIDDTSWMIVFSVGFCFGAAGYCLIVLDFDTGFAAGFVAGFVVVFDFEAGLTVTGFSGLFYSLASCFATA